jgi:hypothetical protein
MIPDGVTLEPRSLTAGKRVDGAWSSCILTPLHKQCAFGSRTHADCCEPAFVEGAPSD